MSAYGTKRTYCTAPWMSASLIGLSRSSAFRLFPFAMLMSLAGSCFSSESALKALPSWSSKARQNNLSGGLVVKRTAGPSGHTILPHPSSHEGHHSTARWNSMFSYPIAPVRLSCRHFFPGPLELGAINPHAVHDHSEPACQRHDRLLPPACLGNLHRPGPKPRPSR